MNHRIMHSKIVLTFVFLLSAPCPSLYAEKKPNILYLLADEWRGNATGYGAIRM